MSNNEELTIIDTLPFSTRTKNCLRYEGIEHPAQLIGVSAEQLMRIPNMGKKSVDEVLSFMSGAPERTPLSLQMEIDKLEARIAELKYERERATNWIARFSGQVTRNWQIVVDAGTNIKVKQADIAAKYGISASRVAGILEKHTRRARIRALKGQPFYYHGRANFVRDGYRPAPGWYKFVDLVEYTGYKEDRFEGSRMLGPFNTITEALNAK